MAGMPWNDVTSKDEVIPLVSPALGGRGHDEARSAGWQDTPRAYLALFDAQVASLSVCHAAGADSDAAF